MKLNIENNSPTKKKMEKSKLKYRYNKAYTYIISLLVSILSWVIITLQSYNTHTLRIPIDYSNIENAYYINNPKSEFIEVEFKAKTIDLLNLINSNFVYNLNRSKILDDKYIQISKKDIEDYVASILPSSITLMKLYPNDINLDVSIKSSKTIPISTHFNIPIENGYMAYPYIIEPASVMVYGSKKDLDNISELELSIPNFDNKFIDTTQFTAKIKLPKGISSNIKKVSVKAPIEIISEMKIDLPITVVGLPTDTTLYVLPDNATVNLAMPISKLRELKTNKDFKIEHRVVIGVTYPRNDDNNAEIKNILPITMIEKPEWIVNYSISPKEVQYIVSQNKKK